jgi:hypothetical protein
MTQPPLTTGNAAGQERGFRTTLRACPYGAVSART